jgi:hypothetical protein
MSDILVGYFTASKQLNQFTITHHGLLNGDQVRFALGATGNTLPSPLVEGTWYFVVNATSGTFQISATSGGAIIILANIGTGSNEAWSPGPTANVWVYEMLTTQITEPALTVDITEVNYYAQRGWELYFIGQGIITGGRFWFLMRKQEPPAI